MFGPQATAPPQQPPQVSAYFNPAFSGSLPHQHHAAAHVSLMAGAVAPSAGGPAAAATSTAKAVSESEAAIAVLRRSVSADPMHRHGAAAPGGATRPDNDSRRRRQWEVPSPQVRVGGRLLVALRVGAVW